MQSKALVRALCCVWMLLLVNAHNAVMNGSVETGMERFEDDLAAILLSDMAVNSSEANGSHDVDQFYAAQEYIRQMKEDNARRYEEDGVDIAGEANEVESTDDKEKSREPDATDTGTRFEDLPPSGDQHLLLSPTVADDATFWELFKDQLRRERVQDDAIYDHGLR